MPYSMATRDKSFLLTERGLSVCLWKHGWRLLSVSQKCCGLQTSGGLKNQHTDLSGDMASAGKCSKNVHFLALHFLTCSMDEGGRSKKVCFFEGVVFPSCALSCSRTQQGVQDVWIITGLSQFDTNWGPKHFSAVYFFRRMLKKFFSAGFTPNVWAVHKSVSCSVLVGSSHLAGYSSLRNRRKEVHPVTSTVWAALGLSSQYYWGPAQSTAEQGSLSKSECDCSCLNS